MSLLSFIECTDFYKTDHRRQGAPGTQRILENFTPRAGRSETCDFAVFFGLDAHLYYDLGELAKDTFFCQPLHKVLDEYQELLDSCLGPNNIGTDHIKALHELGYLPLMYSALPEGTVVPYKIPMFTVENTLDDFWWVAGYLETLTSSRVWQACTSATQALINRRVLDKWCAITGGDESFLPYQGHDFSFRGMGSPEAAAISGGGHALCFMGSDTIPVRRVLRTVYGALKNVIGSVAATEHMVMCLGGKETEIETFRRLLKLYPTQTFSVVSDTWDLWYVLTKILPQIKEEIMTRPGKVVIRPDSGDPADILCGNPKYTTSSPEGAGVVEVQWDLFGGTKNSKEFRSVDPHIGSIYGDSINTARTEDICSRLAKKRFVSTSSALGYGSYTYQYVTRDTHGFAIKATWARVNGEERMLFKDPITDNGTKRSARGRLVVIKDRTAPYGLRLLDGLTLREANMFDRVNELQPVWINGHFTGPGNNFENMRKRVREHG